MNNERIFSTIILLALFMLVACGTAVSPEPLRPTNTPVQEAKPSQPPTVTITPTNTPTATHTPTPLPTAPPEPTETAAKMPEATQTASPTSAAWIPEVIPQDIVTFSSHALAEYTGITISFQHPRSWQTSYFSDSGFFGWLVSDADPNEAFWHAFRTFEEIVILIMPVDDLSNMEDLPVDAETIQLETDGRVARYTIVNGEVRGNVVKDEIAYEIFGDFPTEKEAELREHIETIFATFAWEELGDTDLSDVWWEGTRSEGQIEVGSTAVGYVPLASISEWDFVGAENQEISLTIDTNNPEIMLGLDILDEDDKSLMSDGLHDFTRSITLNSVKIPADGTYRIQVIASTGFFKMGPWNPPSEAKVYGWYEISLK